MDLVDEQHVALVELGEDGGQVAGPLDGGARRGVEVGVDLGGDDGRQRRLPQARGAGEEQVVGRLAPAAGGLEQDLEVGLELGLAHELRQPPGPHAPLGRRILGDRLGVEQLLPHHGQAPAASRLSAWRSSAAASPSSGSSAVATRTSSAV